MEQKFYVCSHCGNIIAKVKDAGVPVMCCGQKLQEIVPNTTDAAQEKHVPKYVIDNNKVIVDIGSIAHPMIEEHFIEWVSLQTNLGNQRKLLKPNTAPHVEFAILDGEKVEAVYTYCNLHGLWKA